MVDCLEDDEMMKQWKDVSKQEEKITIRKMEGRMQNKLEGCKRHRSGYLKFLNKRKEAKAGEEEQQGGWLVHRKDGGERKRACV